MWDVGRVWESMCLARDGLGGEWIRGLGLGFTNPVGQRECWMCVCVWAAVVWTEYVLNG